MVSAALTWLRVTKTLFVNAKGFKVKTKNYHQHHKKNYFLPLIRSIYEKIGFSFKMVQRSIQLVLFTIFRKKQKTWHYIKKYQWPPKSPNSNSLHYYFWNQVETKVYEDRLNTLLKVKK